MADPCDPCPSWWAAAARDACERGREARGCNTPKPQPPKPEQPPATGGGGGGSPPSTGGTGGGGGGGGDIAPVQTPMVTPISYTPPVSSGPGISANQIQSLLTANTNVPVTSGGTATPTPNLNANAFQMRGNQMLAQGQAAGAQASKALTNKFAGRGFSTASHALGQQKMLAGLMGHAQGMGEANKEQIAMGGEDQSYAAIKRQMELDRVRNAQMMQQAGKQAQLGILGSLTGLL